MTALLKSDYAAFSDMELAARFGARDPMAVHVLTERHNQRLFQVAWGILRNHADAEDVVQTTYSRAFAAIESFRGHSSLSTWLTRIAINEALGRTRATRRRRARLDAHSVTDLDEYREKLMQGSNDRGGPESALAVKQVRRLLEFAIAGLPVEFRLVFILRHVEGLSIEEVAQALEILPATVKTRLLRARRRLQQTLEADVKDSLAGAFPFAGAYCAALTARAVADICGGKATPAKDP
ncbi:RNA polymerase sigma factor [Sphingobium nicotianae]|uniref:RNA polymerase sigma factor n=1 Tax=Sphingobium nicotianae TaxID=2782607 RepID=A0A9X1DHG2_9SPHN|nr:RNA polymerase sigma factor [Sphingobium nicotianae]MBT2189393.1 RNA polymerase sigma factor [Sphingobium nicotianae]